MTGRVLLYGATGFSGGAIARRLRDQGRTPIVAGRDGGRIRAVAESLNAPWRGFDLADRPALDAALADVSLVLHAAGPFVQTAPPMIDACIRGGAHYLDIAGEWPVFALAQQRSGDAVAAGVMLMPGAAFSIVVSDCLMARAVRRIPDVVALRIAGSSPAAVTRASLRSAINLTDADVIVRRHGSVERTPAGELSRGFNFGAGERISVAVSGPDVITGEQTTGIQNIETYIEAPLASRLALRAGGLASAVYGPAITRGALRSLSRWWPEPAPEQDAAVWRNAVVVETVDRWRRTSRLGLRTIDSYEVTTRAAAAIAHRVAGGDHSPGFQTPAGLFGPEFVLDLGGVSPFDASALADPGAPAAW